MPALSLSDTIMSPARLHRERLAAAAAKPRPQSIVPSDGGGQPPLPAITPALEHRLSMAMAANAGATAEDLQLAFGVDPAVAQIMLRLTHDLRRLKDIHSIEAKIEAKRGMLPDYREWCELRLAAGAAADGGRRASRRRLPRPRGRARPSPARGWRAA